MKEIAPQEWVSEMDFHMPAESSWAEEDEVPILEDLQIAEAAPSSRLRTVLRFIAMAGAAAAVANIGMQHFHSMSSAFQTRSGKSKKNDDFVLPLRF